MKKSLADIIEDQQNGIETPDAFGLYVNNAEARVS